MKIAEIKNKHNFLAQLEQKSYLVALGLAVDDYMTGLSSDSESEISEVELSSDDGNESSCPVRAIGQDMKNERFVGNSFISSEQTADSFTCQLEQTIPNSDYTDFFQNQDNDVLVVNPGLIMTASILPMSTQI